MIETSFISINSDNNSDKNKADEIDNFIKKTIRSVQALNYASGQLKSSLSDCEEQKKYPIKVIAFS